jgi:hypothetical protein
MTFIRRHAQADRRVVVDGDRFANRGAAGGRCCENWRESTILGAEVHRVPDPIGYSFLKIGKVHEAYAAATNAATIDASRFEAYALATLALHILDEDGVVRQNFIRR